MDATKQVFQSFWYGNAVSPYEKMCMKSFIDHGHVFHIYTYSPELEVPAGVELKDASEIIDPSEYFTLNNGAGAGSHAPFSDLFRYMLLAQRGGWWVDTDVVCLTREIPSFDEFFAHESRSVGTAVLHFKRADPAILSILEEAARIRGNGRYGDTGPPLVTRILENSGRIIGAQPKTACYPTYYPEALDVLKPEKARVLTDCTRGSLMLHLWNEIFRRRNVSKTMLPPRGSFLREISERHPVEGWHGEYEAGFLEHTLNMEIELARLRKENKRLQKPLHAVARSVGITPAIRQWKLVALLRSLKVRVENAYATNAQHAS